jgi:hypothetical protein
VLGQVQNTGDDFNREAMGGSKRGIGMSDKWKHSWLGSDGSFFCILQVH